MTEGKGKHRVRCPECGERAFFFRHASGWHYCMECAARFTWLEFAGWLMP